MEFSHMAHLLLTKQMIAMTNKLKIASMLTVVVAAIVAALANTTPTVFESGFIKSLKEKFKSFYNNTSQDRLYVQTDKTLYQPGETLWLTAFLRDEQTLQPSSKSDVVHVELITPKGTVAKHFKIVATNGSAQGDVDLAGLVGGIYKLKAYTQYQQNNKNLLAFEKDITIQSTVQPRLKMKLEFEKKAYGKGDKVVANLELNKNDNTALANTKVKFVATVDGQEINAGTATTDASGKTQLQFVLPKELNTIDGLLNAMIDFEGRTESISRSVPIVLNKIDLQFYPEGGDMVNGMNSRVAFKAVNEFGKPADVEGIIVDEKGAFVQKFSSYHFGMGAVAFTPQNGHTYKARITKPTGILEEYTLPEVLRAGYVLQVQPGINEQLLVKVNSWQEEELHLIAQTRGNITYAKSFKAPKGESTLPLNVKDFPIGVSQITLFDSKGIARCERLAFVGKTKQLNISVTTDKDQYQPREKVTMNIRVTDENGLPMPGNFALSVVDDNLLSFADDKQGNILAKMLLEPDLKEKVEEANFYFDKKEEKATLALDYLLMTSGWRHYTWQQITDNQFAGLTHQPEKAELTGVVMDAYTAKPIAGAVVKVKDSGKSVVTGADGKFTLRGFDIARYPNVEISAANFTTQNQTLYNYGSTSYYLYNNSYTYYNRGWAEGDAAIPMAAEAVEFKRDKVIVAAKAGKKMEEKNIVAGNARVENRMMFDMADVALPPVPPPDDANVDQKPADIDDVQYKESEKSKVKDFRADMFKEPAMVVANGAMFYRAKEFPKRKYTAADTIRNDFASTVYWNGNVATDRSGRAKVEFVCNDLISSFRATMEGFATDGSIGHIEQTYSTQLPFSMDVKAPVEAVAGDKLMIPVFLKNTTTTTITGSLFVLAPKQLHIQTKTNAITIAPNQSQLVYVEATVANEIGEGNLEVKFLGGKYQDTYTQKIKTVAKGFPASISVSAQELSKEFFINPANVVPGSMKVTLTAYPSIMSDLMSGIDAILREPYGCFEQTSSSNYPNIMAMQYLQTSQTANPTVEARAKKLLDDGYKKLIAFETKESGYEWFGAAPAHEALTAYGLMEFVDMKTVYPKVDDKMIERTVNLLLEKRDGNGGFKKNPRALDSFGGADADITNCYIVYAMSEAGKAALVEKEIDASYREAKKSGDAYMLALMANTMFNKGDNKRGEELLSMLFNAQQESGFWSGRKHSITRSTGQSLKIETTALVALAAMKSPSANHAAITSAAKFLVANRSGYGMFGSTQSTILALKALTKYAEHSKRTDESGTIQLYVNNELVGEKDFAKGEKGNIELSGLEQFVKDGKQKIEVRFKGNKTALPYSFNASYSTTLPESSKECVVHLQTKLSAKQVNVGETLRLTAILKNTTNQGQPMTMAIIGIPAGFSAQPWQLKELQEKGIVDFYEISGNNIACYYRDMAPGEEQKINLDLKAEIPGEYSAPASSAYLYYTNEHKHWVGLDKVYVNP